MNNGEINRQSISEMLMKYECKMVTKYGQSPSQVSTNVAPTYWSTSDLYSQQTCRSILTEILIKCQASVRRTSADTWSTLNRRVGRGVG